MEEIRNLLVDDELVEARRAMLRASALVKDEAQRAVLQAYQAAAHIFEDGDETPIQPREAGVEYLTYLARALSELGQRADDDRLLEQADRLFAGSEYTELNALLLVNHAVVLRCLGDLDGAVDRFQRSLALEPHRSKAFVMLAECLSEIGRLDEAAAAYRRYLEAEPDDAHHWVSLAITESSAGRFHEAQQAYWRAAGIEPSNVSLHFNWFVTALRLEDPKVADDALERLQSVAPNDWRAALAGAWIKQRAGAGEEAAMDIAQLFLKTPPDAPQAAYLAGAALAAQREAKLPLAADEPVVARVFDALLLDRDVLWELRQRDGTVYGGEHPYRMLVKARTLELAYYVTLEVIAPDARMATQLAQQFERRCGAAEVVVEEVTELDPTPDGEQPAGVSWRSGHAYFPLDEWNGEA